MKPSRQMLPLTAEQQATAAQWFPWSQRFAVQWASKRRLSHRADAAKSAAAIGLVHAVARWNPKGGSSLRTWAVLYMRSFLQKVLERESGAVTRWRNRTGVEDVSLDAPLSSEDDAASRLDLLPVEEDMSPELRADIALHGRTHLENLRSEIARRVPFRTRDLRMVAAEAFLSRAGGALLDEIGGQHGVCRERARTYVLDGQAAFEAYAAEVRGEPAPKPRAPPLPRAARMPGKKLTPRETEEKRPEAIERYAAGETAVSVARSLGIAHTTVLKWARDSGVPIRARGSSKKRGPQWRAV